MKLSNLTPFLSFKLNHWQPQEPLEYSLSSEKSHFGYYVTCAIFHEKAKSKIIVTSRVFNCLEKWWGCELHPTLLAWDSELDLIKWNPLILVNPPTPNCTLYFCNGEHESYVWTTYAKMSGKLIFFKGMLMHITENNDELIFGYIVIPNKTHLEYKVLQNNEDQFQICKTGTTDHTCASSYLQSKFKLKSPNDMLHALAISHYS